MAPRADEGPARVVVVLVPVFLWSLRSFVPPGTFVLGVGFFRPWILLVLVVGDIVACLLLGDLACVLVGAGVSPRNSSRPRSPVQESEFPGAARRPVVLVPILMVSEVPSSVLISSETGMDSERR